MSTFYNVMNSEYILYLDMDGVLVDFGNGYRRLVGKSIQEVSNTEGEDSARERYLQSGAQFWANLEWIKGGRELWDASKELFEHVCILSSTGTTDPTRGAIVEEGKRIWLKNNMPDMEQSKTFIVRGSHLKKTYASKNGILVDDVPLTIKEWNAAGGYGILHDSRNYKKTIETLEDIARPLNLTEIMKHIRH